MKEYNNFYYQPRNYGCRYNEIIKNGYISCRYSAIAYESGKRIKGFNKDLSLKK